ncbi:MAG: alpha/beta hydrolase family protein [Thermosynechococcaceae cyanobacterium]
MAIRLRSQSSQLPTLYQRLGLPLLIMIALLPLPALGQVKPHAALEHLQDACPPPRNTPASNPSKNPDPISVQYKTENFVTRQPIERQVIADLYLPARLQPKTPVLVMSPGWGSHYKEYDALARSFTAHQFVVVIVNHPGSNEAQKQAVCHGKATALVDANEFIYRSVDVKQVLNQLETLNRKHYRGRLNLKQVGIYGYSLGGITALTLAGAQFDFAQLHRDCLSQKPSSNLSLTVLCLARKLPQQDYRLKDKRIKAVFLVNPVSASIFGSEGLKTIKAPVFWMAGDSDLVTPLASEHLPSFEALGTESKYLAIAQGAAHIDWNIGPESLQTYLKTFGLAFFQMYVANHSEYGTQLTSSYAQQMSSSAFPLKLSTVLLNQDDSQTAALKHLK